MKEKIASKMAYNKDTLKSAFAAVKKGKNPFSPKTYKQANLEGNPHIPESLKK